MILGDLIDGLKKFPRDLVLASGFGRPMSYRGYYDQLAFEPAKDVTVASMIANAESAVDQTFEGYKGGSYTMTLRTCTHIASYGDSNEDDFTMMRWFMCIEHNIRMAREKRLEELLRAAFRGLDPVGHPLGPPDWYEAAREEFPEVVLGPPPKRTKVRCAPDALGRVRELFPDADISVEAERASGNFIVDLGGE